MKKFFISLMLLITFMLPTFLSLNVHATEAGGSGGTFFDYKYHAFCYYTNMWDCFYEVDFSERPIVQLGTNPGDLSIYLSVHGNFREVYRNKDGSIYNTRINNNTYSGSIYFRDWNGYSGNHPDWGCVYINYCDFTPVYPAGFDKSTIASMIKDANPPDDGYSVVVDDCDLTCCLCGFTGHVPPNIFWTNGNGDYICDACYKKQNNVQDKCFSCGKSANPLYSYNGHLYCKTCYDKAKQNSDNGVSADGISDLPSLFTSLNNTFKNLAPQVKGTMDLFSSCFTFLPSWFWALIFLGLAALILLRILGR